MAKDRYIGDVLHVWRVQDACVFLGCLGVAFIVLSALPIPKDVAALHASEMQNLSTLFHFFLAFWCLCAAVLSMVFLYGCLYKKGYDAAANRIKRCLPFIGDYFFWG